MRRFFYFYILFGIFSPYTFSASKTYYTNNVGVISDVNIPISINIIKSTCDINNGAGIPSLVNLGNISLGQEKRIPIQIIFSNCLNVKKIDYEFKPISSFNFIGNGVFSTSNPNINLTLYDGNNILSTYTGSVNVISGSASIPLGVSVNAHKKGAYQSAISLSIIYR